jgi:hypothetical protein
LLEDLLLIDLGIELRCARQQGGEEPGELGSLPRGGEELLGVLGQECGIPARAIASVSGLTQSRMAYCEAPKICTWPMPGTRVIGSLMLTYA